MNAEDQRIGLTTWRLSVKVGDLVRIKEYCRKGGTLAIVVGQFNSGVKILELDTGCVTSAIKQNLEVLS